MYGHDYAVPGTYEVTIVVADRRPVFGEIAGSTKKGGEKPHLKPSPLGQTVLDKEIPKIHYYYPEIDIWQVCLMPDHLHLIVRISQPLSKGKHLGIVIGAFKGGISRAWWQLDTTVSAASASDSRSPLFEPNYNDHILEGADELERWFNYLDDNPRRLAVKRQHPEYFTIVRQRNIGEWSCQMVGNQALLSYPKKAAVVVHSAWSDEEYEKRKQKWLALGEKGGVLISAAIATREKVVMREAMNRGYRLIVLRENGFPPLYKPAGESFDACSNGSLLQISPWEYHMNRSIISREKCLQLNRLAELIAYSEFAL